MDTPSFSIRRTTTTSRGRWQGPVWYALVVAGILAHLVFAVAPGNRLRSEWSGGGDTREYVLLAQNLNAGDGYTYAHLPTAFRAPAYPFLLAALMRLAPQHWAQLVYGLQFIASLVMAWMCARLARNWFGVEAGRAALAAALWTPTLLYFTGQMLTEETAALLTILFFIYLDNALRSPRWNALVLTGFFAGAVALERFNAALLAPFACVAVFLWLPPKDATESATRERQRARPGFWSRKRWRRALAVAAVCGVLIAPWVAYTAVSFHGRALYSTHGGFAEVEGVLMPLGRTQPGETAAIESALGWGNWEVESNSPARPGLRDEVALNRQAEAVARQLWRANGRKLVPIVLEKLGAFWLSTEQLLQTRGLSMRNRVARGAGVAIYWVILALGAMGWLRLRQAHPDVARALLFYAILETALHLPLTMNTRLRSPLMDPVLCSLAGGGCAWFLSRFGRQQAPARLGPNLSGQEPRSARSSPCPRVVSTPR